MAVGIFTKEDESLLSVLGDLTNTVLKNIIKHKEQLQAQNKFRIALKSSSQLMKSHQSLKGLIQSFEGSVRQLMNVNQVKAYVLQRESMMCLNAKGSHLLISTKIEEWVEFEKTQGIVGECIRRRQVIGSSSCYQEVNYEPKVDLNTDLPILTYPLLGGCEKEEKKQKEKE